MSKNNKKIIYFGFIISLFFFLIFVFTKDIGQDINSVSPPPETPQEKTAEQAFLEINGKRINTIIADNTDIYSFMKKLQEENKITFTDETYSGMGKFIKEINGIKNGEKNWIYYVNSKKANIGISNYKIKPGDVVSWKYEDNIN